MNDTISRMAAIEALSHMCSEDEDGITVSRANVDSMLKTLPSAQPERKKGEWADNNDMWMCNICGKWIDILQGDADMNFCPNCGADMRGEKRVND